MSEVQIAAEAVELLATVEDVAALKALDHTRLAEGSVHSTLGYASPGRGAASYRLAESGATADDYLVLEPDTSPGDWRWHLLPRQSEVFEPAQAGCVPNDTNVDNTSNMQKVFDAARDNSGIVQLDGLYNIDGEVQDRSNSATDNPIIIQGVSHSAGFTTSGIAENTGGAIVVRTETGTIFRDLQFKDMNRPVRVETASGRVIRNVIFNNVLFRDCVNFGGANNGVVALSDGGSSQRPHPIESLIFYECEFRGGIGSSIVFRSRNITEVYVCNCRFLGITQPASGEGSNTSFTMIRLGDPFAYDPNEVVHGNYIISGNMFRDCISESASGNLSMIGGLNSHVIIVAHNTIYHCGSPVEGRGDCEAITIRSSLWVVTGNHIFEFMGDGTASGADGLLGFKGQQFTGQVWLSIVSNNTVYGCTGPGSNTGLDIFQFDGGNTIFANNVFRDNSALNLIDFRKGGGNVFIGNSCQESGRINYQVSSEFSASSRGMDLCVNNLLDRTQVVFSAPFDSSTSDAPLIVADNIMRTTGNSFVLATNGSQRRLIVRDNYCVVDGGESVGELMSINNKDYVSIRGNTFVFYGSTGIDRAFSIRGSQGYIDFSENYIELNSTTQIRFIQCDSFDTLNFKNNVVVSNSTNSLGSGVLQIAGGVSSAEAFVWGNELYANEATTVWFILPDQNTGLIDMRYNRLRGSVNAALRLDGNTVAEFRAYDNDFGSAAITSIIGGGATTVRKLRHNEGSNAKTEAVGASSIGSSSTSSGNIAHGLNFTPTKQNVILTLHSTLGDAKGIHVESVDGTNLVVDCDTQPGGSGIDFGWEIKAMP